jgi:hypothetical protein
MRVYQYVAWHQPKTKDGEAAIVVDVTTVVAKDEAEVRMIAARKIPDAYAAKLSEVEIAVRPF